MPGGMTGRELAAELKKKKPALKVIFTSGFNSLNGKDSTNGESTFLPKPYLPEEVARLVRNTLDARSPAHLAA
jgi:DNA-binding NtrC family response regulator